MKKLMIYKVLSFHVVLFSVLFSSCSSIPSDVIPYLEESGIYTVTTYAHPTSQIDKYTSKTSGNKILVDVLFTNGFTIKFNLTYKGGYFTDIIIKEDTDSFPAFLGTGMIKSFVTGALTGSGSDDFISNFERKIGKKIDDLSGEKLVLLILNWDYSIFKNQNN